MSGEEGEERWGVGVGGRKGQLRVGWTELNEAASSHTNSRTKGRERGQLGYARSAAEVR